MSQAGNSLDESIGLALGGNMVVRDASVTGTALKTLSLRLTKTKTELSELGEETDGAAETLSDYRAKLLALTNQRVDIMDGDAYKSTTQILREMSGVWDTMTNMQQSAALEIMGGVRQSNVVMSIIQNWDEVERAIETASDSEGSALRENERVLESLTGKLNQLAAAKQAFATSFFDADIFKSLVDGGTSALNVLTQLTNQVGSFSVAGAVINGLFGLGNKGLIRGDLGLLTQKATPTYYTQQQIEDPNVKTSRNAYWTTSFRLGKLPTWEEYQTSKMYSKILSEAKGQSVKVYKDYQGENDQNYVIQTVKDRKFVITDNDINKINEYNSKLDTYNDIVARSGKGSTEAAEALQKVTKASKELPAESQAVLDKMGYVRLGASSLERTSIGTSSIKGVIGANLKSFGSGLLNAAAGMGIGALIQGVIEGINYLVNYDQIQMEAAQQVKDAYNQVAESTKTNIGTLESLQSEFADLSTGVDSMGNNISLSTEQYARYQEIVSQIVGISPSLIAAYDSEGNALANKNQLIERAIELEERRLAVAQQERREEAEKTFSGAKSEVNTAHQSAVDALKELKKADPDLMKSITDKLGTNQGVYTEKATGQTYSFIKRPEYYTLDDFGTILNEYQKEIDRINSMPNPDVERIAKLQSGMQELRLQWNELQQAEKAYVEDGLVFASSITGYDNLSSKAQAAISTMISNVTVDDIIGMGSTDKYFDTISKWVYGFGEKRTQYALDAADVLTTRFNADLSQLDAEGLDPISLVEYRQGIEGVIEALSALGVEHPELLFTDQIAQAEQLEATIQDIQSGYGEGLQLMQRLGSVQAMRGFVKSHNLINAGYQASGSFMAERDVAELANIYNSNDLTSIRRIDQLSELFSSGNYSKSAMESMLRGFKEMDSVSFDNFIRQGQMADEIINALGWTLKDNADDIKQFRDVLANTKLGEELTQLSLDFELGKIDASAYDSGVEHVLTRWSQMEQTLSTSKIDELMNKLSKSLNPQIVSERLTSASRALHDFLDIDTSLRGFSTSGLDEQLEGLQSFHEQAVGAHDLKSATIISEQMAMITAATEHATGPVERLTELTELYATALSEQASMGTLSVETYRALATAGNEYANILSVATDGIHVNEQALSQLIQIESKQAQNLMGSYRTDAIQQYAELADQYERLSETERNGDIGKDLLAEMTQVQDLITNYNTLISTIDQAAGARARLAAVTSAPTAIEESEVFTEGYTQAGEYIEAGRYGDAAKILRELSGQAIETEEDLKRVHQSLSWIGEDAESTLNGLFSRLKSLDASGAFDNIMSSFTEDGWNLMPEDIPVIAKIVGIDEGVLQGLINGAESYDLTFSASVDPQDYISGIEKMQESTNNAYQAIVRDGDTVKINVQELQKMLGTRYSSDFIYGLLNDLNMARDELGLIFTDMSGNELNLLGALDVTGLSQFDSFLATLESYSPRIKAALNDVGGTVAPIDLSEWKATLLALGAGEQEYQQIRDYFATHDIQVVVDGEVKGAEEIPEHLDEIYMAYEQFAGVMGDSVEIGFDLHIDGAGEALAQADVATEAIEKLRGMALEAEDMSVVAQCDIALNIRAEQGDSTDGVKGLIQGVIDTANSVNDINIESGKFEPIAVSASEAQAAVEAVVAAIQAVDGMTATAHIQVNADTSAIDNAQAKVRNFIDSLSGALSASASGTVSGGSSAKSYPKGTVNRENPSNHFATGTNYARPGLALVNDGAPVNGSSAELIIKRRTAEAYIANGGEMGFTELEAGDQVLTAAETQKVLRGQADIRYKRFASGQNTSFGSGSSGSSGNNGSGSNSNKGSGNSGSGSGSGSNSNSNNNTSKNNSSSNETQQTKSEYEKLYAELKHMREMDLKSTKSYLDELDALYQRHLDTSEDKIDDYYKAQEEVYKGYISWVNDEHSRALTKLQQQRDLDLISHAEYIRALEAENARYYEEAKQYYNEANPELEEKLAAQEVEIYKEKKTLHQENYDRAVAELDAMLAYGKMTQLQYYESVNTLNQLFWANNKAYEEEYKKYTLQSFKDIKKAQEELIDERIGTLDFKLAVHLITDSEHFEQKMAELQKKIDLLVSTNAPDTEIEKVIQEMYENRQSYIVQSADKEFAEVERWRDQELISAAEAADRMEEINERMYGDMKDKSEEYLQHQKEIYDLRLDVAKESYDKEMNYLSHLRDFNMINDVEYYKRQAEYIQEYYLKDPSNVKLYNEGMNLALENMAGLRNSKIQQMQDAKSYFTDRIQYEISDLEDRRQDELEPLERQKTLLERQKREVERERNLIARQQRSLQRQESALNREKRALQRIIDANSHSEELELRPIQDEQYELQRREREITRQYSKLIKPYQEAQKVKQREQSRLQHEQELALRPLQKAVDQLNRAQSLLSKQYDDRMYPIQEQIKALEKQKKLAQETLDIDKARAALDKARTEKSFLVYREGLGYVYDTDREAIEEAERSLRELDIEDQINKLQQIVDDLEDERDKLLRPMSDQAFWLNEGIQDIQDYYTALLEPISDMLFDLNEVMQDMSDAQEGMLYPIQERLEDIADLIDAIQRKYELANRPLSDQMFLLNQQGDILTDQLEAIDIQLEEYDAQIDEINDQIEDLDYEISRIGDWYEDQLRVLEKQLRKWGLMAEEAELLRKRQEALEVLGEQMYEWEDKFNDKAFDVNEPWVQIDTQIQNAWQEINRIVTQPGGMQTLLALAKELGYDFEVIGNHILDFDTKCYHSVTTMSQLVAEANKVIAGTVKLSQLVEDAKSYVDHQQTHLQYGQYEDIYYTNPSTGQQTVSNTSNGNYTSSTNTVPAVNTNVEDVKQQSATAQNPNAKTEAALKLITSQADQYKSQMNNLLSLQKSDPTHLKEITALTATIRSFLSTSKATVMKYPGVTGYTSALVSLERLASAMGSSISAYASGRRTGPAELAITQEKGPEAIAAQNNGKFTFLAPGDMVFSKKQTENLWKMSIHPSTVSERGNGVPPRVETHQTQENKYTITIGDVNVQSANDPMELSRAIIEKLPNQILQDIRRR